MRLTTEKTEFTLMPHARECHIGFDFLILFLKADAVNKRKPTGYPNPPILSLAQCRQFPTTSPFKASMYWCREGRINKAETEVPTKQHQMSSDKTASASDVHGLHDEVELFTAKRTIPYQQKGLEPQVSQNGGPVVLHAESGGYLIGVNIGKKITTLYGIFALLKGGIIPFLSVMRHSNARSLQPTKWKEHVLPHVKTLNRHYTWDLLHHLLERKSGSRVLKISPGGFPWDIISGLEMLTAVFDNLKGSGQSFGYYHRHSDGKECKCVRNLYSTILNEHVRQFVHDETGERGTKIVEALFQCFESMTNCGSIAREVLKENIKFLIAIATSERYGSNAVVNKCFKTIILKEHDCMHEEMEHYGRHECYVDIEHNGGHRQ